MVDHNVGCGAGDVGDVDALLNAVDIIRDAPGRPDVPVSVEPIPRVEAGEKGGRFLVPCGNRSGAGIKPIHHPEPVARQGGEFEVDFALGIVDVAEPR